jgi:3-oxoadipate enol-lactonase
MSDATPIHYFAVETGEIAYEVLEPTAGGSGAPTLTLIHNFMSSGRAAWGPLLPVLNRTYRILLPDMPGHGQSIGHPTGFDHHAMARQLAALMQATGALDDSHIVGCSSGGMIAQLLVYHGMVRPSTLTLISTTHSTDPLRSGAPLALTPEQFRAGPNWMEATARLHDPYQGDGYYRRELLPGFRALTPETSIDLSLVDVAKFAMPVCLIHGAEDEIFPELIAQNMAAVLPNGELHIVPGQSHALLFRQPARIASLMTDFLARHSA